MKKLLFLIFFISLPFYTYAKVEENYDYINSTYGKTLNENKASFSFTGGLIFTNELLLENVNIDYTIVDSKKEDLDKKVKEFFDLDFYGDSKPSDDCKRSNISNLKRIRNSIFGNYGLTESDATTEIKKMYTIINEINIFKKKYDTNIKYEGTIVEEYNNEYVKIKEKYIDYMLKKRILNESFKNIYLISNATYETCVKPALETQNTYNKNTSTNNNTSLLISINKNKAFTKTDSSLTKKTISSDEKIINSSKDYLLKFIKKEGEKLSKENKISVYKQLVTELNKLIESENLQK